MSSEQSPAPELPRFLKVQEVAKALRMDPRSVYKLCKQGKLPAKQFGTMWRIYQEKFEALINEGFGIPEQRPSAPKPSPSTPVRKLDAKKILDAWKKKGVVDVPKKGDDA